MEQTEAIFNEVTTLPQLDVSVLMQLGLLAGPFLSMMDGDVVNVALPTVALQLHVPLATAQWIVSSYLLALALILPASAYLARRFGTLRIYQYSLLGFTVTSCACAFAPTIGSLIAARTLQGAFGAPLTPLAIELLFSKKRVARQMPAAAGLLLFLAPSLGPAAGGILIHSFGWPSIFLVNLPFGILGLLGLGQLRKISIAPVNRAVPFDLPGLCLVAGGLTSTIYGAMAANQQGWLDLASWPFWTSGILLLTGYVFWARRQDHPALKVRLVFHTQSALAVGLSAIAAIVLFSMLVLIPIYIQDFQGFSPLVAGLALLPQGLITGVGATISGTISRKLGIRRSVLSGMLLLTLSTGLFLLVNLNTPVWIIALFLSVRGFALGLTTQPLLSTFIQRLKEEDLSDGNTLFNVVERLAGSVGIPLLVTFFQQSELQRFNQLFSKIGVTLTSLPENSNGITVPPAMHEQFAAAMVDGFHQTIGLLVAFSVVGCLLALLLRNPQIEINEQIIQPKDELLDSTQQVIQSEDLQLSIVQPTVWSTNKELGVLEQTIISENETLFINKQPVKGEIDKQMVQSENELLSTIEQVVQSEGKVHDTAERTT